MKKKVRLVPLLVVLASAAWLTGCATNSNNEDKMSKPSDTVDPMLVEQGRQIAFSRKKGNCLACHMIEGGDLPGNIGPPLIAMKARYPDKAKLRAQIWDATAVNPESAMVPFGRLQVLSEEEIDKVVEFVWTL